MPHPGYRTTQHAQGMGLPVVAVQHHHAHLAACLAENLWPRDAGRVAGIILDGTGYGPDGTVWGGEVLLGDYDGIQRVAHLAPAPLPGGDRAARQPWRNLLMRLDQAGLADIADRWLGDFPRDPVRAAAQAGVNAPMGSSAGRLFDAVAAALGICRAAQSFEGEAAMRLEALATDAAEAPYPFAGNGPAIDPAPMMRALAADIAADAEPAASRRASMPGWRRLSVARPAPWSRPGRPKRWRCRGGVSRMRG